MVAKTNDQINQLFDNTNLFSEEESIEPLPMTSEEPKKEEFTMPHYRFDENGIIISE